MRFLFTFLLIWLGIAVMTGLWVAAQIMHWFVPIAVLLVILAFWDKLRGAPARASADPSQADK